MDTPSVVVQFQDLFRCQGLRDHLMNYEPVSSESIVQEEGNCTLISPLAGARIFEIPDVLDSFNSNCGDSGGSVGTGGDGPVEPRSTCDRDEVVNGRELIEDVRSLNGKAVLRQCDRWCSWWDKNCFFQVDVAIPSSTASDATWSIIGKTTKVFSVNEKRLRKGWRADRIIPITEWLYLEGRHGDEWQYSWTGRHRRRGTTSERTVGLSLANKIKFKLGPIEAEKTIGPSVSFKVSRANEDCVLGDDIARYCRSLRERCYTGDLYFLLNEQGH